jgi:predicted nucleotidyltransferase
MIRVDQGCCDERDIDAVRAANRYVERYHPDCRTALLVGSAASGRTDAHSDVDLIMIERRLRSPYRFIRAEEGRVFETHVWKEATAELMLERSVESGTGAAVRMIAFGRLLRDDEERCGARLQAKAAELWHAGPPPWSLDEMNEARYAITEELLDLLDAEDETSAWFITGRLVSLTADFALRTEGHWSGVGKWLLRALRESAPEAADALEDALRRLQALHDAQPLAAFIRETLEPYGGLLLEGYRQPIAPRSGSRRR